MSEGLRFTSLERVKVRIRGMELRIVANPSECHDFSHLIGAEVEIDGEKRIVGGVERYCHTPPWRKGESIGLALKAKTGDR